MIGMFDSGIGGLTVLQQITCKLPNESIIYFGDTARLPYGGKSPETIVRYSLENAAFLMEHDIKLLVVACNTASAYAIDALQQRLGIPVVGVIDPGADKAVHVTKNGHIAVLGTKATILSGAYTSAINRRLQGSQVYSIACPLFVPLVEEHMAHHPATRLIVKEYLHSLKNKEIDTLLLGCTHYPLLRDVIQEEISPSVQIIDSASTCADAVLQVLQSHQIQANEGHIPQYHYFVSDDPEKFRTLAQNLLGIFIPQPPGILEQASALPG